MANQTTCPSCNALLRSASPLPQGATIKCPKCGTSFRVGEQAAGKPAARASSGSSGGTPSFTGEDDAGRIVAPPKKKGSKTLFWLLILGGGFILCGGCCGVVVTVGVIFYNKLTTDKTLVGKWELDEAESKKLNPLGDFKAKCTYEFKDDNTATLTEGNKVRKGKWTPVRYQDQLTVVFEDGDKGAAQTIKMRVIDNDHIEVLEANPPEGTPFPARWKRVSGGAATSK